MQEKIRNLKRLSLSFLRFATVPFYSFNVIISLLPIGVPSYKNGKLLKYQVFIGGLPTHIDDVFEKCPQIKKLFVAISELPEAERAIAKAGTPMNKYYQAAVLAEKEE